MAAGGSTAWLVGFKRHLRAEVVDDNHVYVYSEHGVIALTGHRIGTLAALLDGTMNVSAVLGARPGGMDVDQVRRLLDRLVDAGLVAVRPNAAIDDEARAYWDACGVDRTATVAPLVRLVVVSEAVDERAASDALGSAGLTVVAEPSSDVGLTVVLCDDYLDPNLVVIDAAQRATGAPWLLAKPVGAQLWLGPVFRPDESACWHCMAIRLWGNRHAEACAQVKLGRSGPAPKPCPTMPVLLMTALHLVALEAAKWLAGHRYPGQNRVWTLDTISMAGQRHELRARPQCPSCGDPGLVSRRVHEPVRLRQASAVDTADATGGTLFPHQILDRYRHLVSPVTGVVRDLVPIRTAPPFVHAYRSAPNVARRACSDTYRAQCGGTGTNATDAETSALCEALERFSGQFHGDEPRIRDSLNGLGEWAVDPSTCLLYDPRQFRDRATWNAAHSPLQYVGEPFDPDAVLDWTPVWSLTGERSRLLPTAMLYYGVPDPIASRFLRADSNGCAAGATLEDAVLGGLLELVERDAVALWWYNRTPVPGIDLASLGDPWLAAQVGEHAGIGRELWLLDLTADLPVAVTAAVSRVARPSAGASEYIVLGFGAHLDPAIAARRAVSEANQFLPSVTGSGVTPAQFAAEDPDLAEWFARATLANQPYLCPLPARESAPALYAGADVATLVTALVGELAVREMETLVLDQTRPDVGLAVVKVVVPGLRHFWGRFAAGRLFDVPVRLGRLERPTAYEKLNPLPLFL